MLLRPFGKKDDTTLNKEYGNAIIKENQAAFRRAGRARADIEHIAKKLEEKGEIDIAFELYKIANQVETDLIKYS